MRARSHAQTPSEAWAESWLELNFRGTLVSQYELQLARRIDWVLSPDQEHEPLLAFLGMATPRGIVLLELESSTLTEKAIARMLANLEHERARVPEVAGLFLCKRKPCRLLSRGLLLPTERRGVYQGKRLQGWSAELWFRVVVPQELSEGPESLKLRLAAETDQERRVELLRQLPPSDAEAWMQGQAERLKQVNTVSKPAREDGRSFVERVLREEREAPGTWINVPWVEKMMELERETEHRVRQEAERRVRQETERRIRQETERRIRQESMLHRLWQAVLAQAQALAPELLPELEQAQDPEQAQQLLFEHMKQRFA